MENDRQEMIARTSQNANDCYFARDIWEWTGYAAGHAASPAAKPGLPAQQPEYQVYTEGFAQIIGVTGRNTMDIYDYDEEHLSLAAGNCRYFHFRQQKKPPGINAGVSCTECGSWNGTGCRRQQLDKISAEMHLD